MPKITKSNDPVEIAYFRFGVIAPIIQGTFPDASEAAYYRRVLGTMGQPLPQERNGRADAKEPQGQGNIPCDR